MDGESIYESDISESWSLIDINLNEESVSVTNAQLKLKESYLPDPKDVSLKQSDSTELEDFVKQCRESMTDFCHSDSDSDSDSDSSEENNEIFKENESDRNSDQDKNDSCDAESIEILDMDGNHMDSEIERLDISMIDNQELENCAYQLDDEESWGGNIDNKNRSTSLTVIQRKRNLVRHSKSSDEIVNSDIISKGNLNLSSNSNDGKKLKVQLNARSSLPVHKHYRNNVVSTVLSLSVGIVFAAVACIVIWHFLGVHDAAETAMELVDTLKKLQMENVAFQSCCSELNKAALKKNINSKFKCTPVTPPETVSCEEKPHYGPARTKTTNIDQAGLSENQSTQWLTKLENMINEKIKNEGNEIDLSSIGKYIQNQLNTLNDKKIEEFKLLEDSDKKISKLLRKIIERLSASQENMEKLYDRLIRLKNKMNHKLFPGKVQRKVPVTEKNLNSVQWYPTVENPHEELSKSIRVFEFPQPEEFYETKNNFIMTEEQTMTTNNTLKEKEEQKVKKEGKNRKKREKKWREKSKDVEKKSQRKLKNSAKISDNIKRYNSNEMKYAFGRFNETKENTKMFANGKVEKKPKRKVKKMKKSKILKGALLKPVKRNHLNRNRYSRVCFGYECFNLTGYWVFKYADGRKEFRHRQKLSDWQFERAKGRKEQRDEYDEGSWQFKRALARENGRNGKRWDRELYRKNYESQNFLREKIS